MDKFWENGELLHWCIQNIPPSHWCEWYGQIRFGSGMSPHKIQKRSLESISACYAQNRPILPEFLKAHGNARYIQSMRNAPHFFLDAHARRPYVTSAAAWSRAPSSASAPPPPPASPPAPPRPRSGPAPPSSRAPPPPPAGPPPSSTRPAPASPLPVRVRARARARPHDPGADNPTLGPLCVRFRVGGGACGPLRAHRLWPGGWS